MVGEGVSSGWWRGPWPARCGLVLVLMLVAWLYAPTLGYDFVMFDDDVNIYANPHLGEITPERVAWAFTGFDYLPRLMPMAWLALMGVFEVAGMSSAAYHALNLGLHLADMTLVYAVTGLALRLAARTRGTTPEPGWHAALALAAAAAWGLHPLRSESIAWATGWVYPLSNFGALLAAWFALRRHEAGTAWRRRSCVAAATVAYAFSVLTYPATLGLPIVVLAFDIWLARGESENRPRTRELMRTHALWGTILVLALALNVWARIERNRAYPPAPAMAEFTLENRVAQAVDSVSRYLVRQTWAGETSPVYDLKPPGRLATWPTGVLALAWLGASVWALTCWRRAPGRVCGMAAFLGAVAPFSGFMDYPFQPSDRYSYLPAWVLLATLALGMARARPGVARAWLIGGMAVWCGWLAAAVPRQLPKWRDSEALFEHLAGSLRSPEGRLGYGVSRAMYRARQGDFEAAERLLREAEASGADPAVLAERRARIAEQEGAARAPMTIPNARGLVAPDAILSYLFALRDVKAGEMRGAYFRFMQTLAIDADFHDARYNLAIWLAMQGRTEEAQAQIEELRRRAGDALTPALMERLDERIRANQGGGVS